MSHEVNTMMEENITDDVWNAFNDSSVIDVEINYMFVGDDGESLDGSVEARAIFRGNRYRILPDTIEPLFDEHHPDNYNAKIDYDFAKMLIDDDPELFEELEKEANSYLSKDKFMMTYMEKLIEFSGKLSGKMPSSDPILYAIAEDEIERWYEMPGPHG